jgi:hypothetical protein
MHMIDMHYRWNRGIWHGDTVCLPLPKQHCLCHWLVGDNSSKDILFVCVQERYPSINVFSNVVDLENILET